MALILSNLTSAYAQVQKQPRPTDENVTFIGTGVDENGPYELYVINYNKLSPANSSGTKYFEAMVIYNGHVDEMFISSNHWFEIDGYTGYLQLDYFVYDYSSGGHKETYCFYSGYLSN